MQTEAWVSATTTRPAQHNGQTAGAGPTTGGVRAAPPRLPSGRPKTPPLMIALCLLLILGCGAAAGALVLSGEHTIRVVVAARTLPAGTVISGGDLRAGELSGSGLAAIPAGEAGTLLGKTVISAVPAGTLLNARMVAKDPPPAAGSVAVGLALTAGQLPAQQLTPGRQVTIYELPAKDDSASAVGSADVLVDRAEVLSVTAGSGSGGYQVSVVVPEGDAAGVSAAAADGRAALGLLPAGEG